jgi:hypothetical protein
MPGPQRRGARAGQQLPRRRVVGRGLHHLFEERRGVRGGVVEDLAALADDAARLEEDLVDRRVGELGLAGRRQGDLQGFGDGFGDLFLEGEDVGQVAVEAVGPQGDLAIAFHELGGDAHPRTAASDRSVEQVRGVQFRGHLAHGFLCPAELEAGAARDDLEVGGPDDRLLDFLGHAVGEIGRFRIAGEIVERQHGQQPFPGAWRREVRRRRRRVTADQLADAGQDLQPSGRAEVAVPPRQPGALHAVERQRRHRLVEAELDQGAVAVGHVGLRRHPARLHRVDGPQDQHRLGRAQVFLDHGGKVTVGGELVVYPDAVASGAEGLGDLVRGRGRRVGIGDEDFSHHAPAFSRLPAPRSSSGSQHLYGRTGRRYN